jgi:DNA-binding PadR family transcriptional regulator
MQRKTPKKTTADFSACACSGANLPKLVQPSILAALSKEPLHGYALAQRLARAGAHLNAPPDHSGIYRLLRGMEKRGLLTSRLAESESGPARREYVLTDRGRLCLERWVKALSLYRDTIDAVLKTCRTEKKEVTLCR